MRKEEKSFTAINAEGAKENSSLTAKNAEAAKETRIESSIPRPLRQRQVGTWITYRDY